jgi:5-methylthioribose kinase
MLELNVENTPEYLRSHGWIGAGPVQVEALGGGVSGVVFRVASPERTFVLKQSRSQLRTTAAWFSDLDRIWREMEVMQALGPLLPPLTVPEVLFHDRAHYVIAMTHAPEPFRVWKEDLLAGQATLPAARLVGQVLGRMHQGTAGNHRLREQFADVRIFEQLRIEPFYRTVQQRCPDVAQRIEPLIERMYHVKDAICHGDYTPKNILTHAYGFTLVDYETAHYGDPSMDVGLLLAHLLLKAFFRPAAWDPFLIAAGHVVDEYASAVSYRPAGDLEAWGIEHCAACLLARIDGTSPVDYLPEEPKREAVRQVARQLLRDRLRRWEDVLQMVMIALAALNLSRATP